MPRGLRLAPRRRRLKAAASSASAARAPAASQFDSAGSTPLARSPSLRLAAAARPSTRSPPRGRPPPRSSSTRPRSTPAERGQGNELLHMVRARLPAAARALSSARSLTAARPAASQFYGATKFNAVCGTRPLPVAPQMFLGRSRGQVRVHEPRVDAEVEIADVEFRHPETPAARDFRLNERGAVPGAAPAAGPCVKTLAVRNAAKKSPRHYLRLYVQPPPRAQAFLALQPEQMESCSLVDPFFSFLAYSTT